MADGRLWLWLWVSDLTPTTQLHPLPRRARSHLATHAHPQPLASPQLLEDSDGAPSRVALAIVRRVPSICFLRLQRRHVPSLCLLCLEAVDGVSRCVGSQLARGALTS
ncbi:hypothetical protein BU26DRAFT_511434 [Trematosphaeria pertusa]|uniref:Uncharacterized protein n=1 Tax=Trematosphaeria pertusa TaxID=390896 RepID=A0A6A6HU57_9PLEO|nr:uncharacterized protein BU26DRAFT_511434 [Trematosphaeria pertusa]KAF2241322.1 hypothetical protein BU26DRAFT_511434 [Trematosphaeria pertusa]